MQAMVYRKYGSRDDVLHLHDFEELVVKGDEVLI